LYPDIKTTLIDRRAEKFLYQIERKMEGERKLVLVNSWHID